jgi:cytochrome c-type biogenesis protein CcmH/NrfG
VSITIGWWAIPAFVTIAAVYIALREAPTSSGRDYGASAFIGVVMMMAALIVSLVAWLIWAIFS